VAIRQQVVSMAERKGSPRAVPMPRWCVEKMQRWANALAAKLLAVREAVLQIFLGRIMFPEVNIDRSNSNRMLTTICQQNSSPLRKHVA
jgi:hypothetical protein